MSERLEQSRGIFHTAVVLLDDLGPNGAFRHALDWARHLGVPLHGVRIPPRRENAAVADGDRRTPPTDGPARLDEAWDGVPTPQEAALTRACAAACGRANVPWRLTRWPAHQADQLGDVVGRTDLLVVGQRLGSLGRTVVAEQLARLDSPPVLVCSDAWKPVSRILVLDEGQGAKADHLASGAAVARCFGAGIVVLTVARSERTARVRQQAARAAVARYRMTADFDLAVGTDVATAVAQVARWRRCSLVVHKRHSGRGWWFWPRQTATESLLGIGGDLALLTLPEAVAVAYVGHGTIPRTVGGWAGH
jgi:hypothetical protein